MVTILMKILQDHRNFHLYIKANILKNLIQRNLSCFDASLRSLYFNISNTVFYWNDYMPGKLCLYIYKCISLESRQWVCEVAIHKIVYMYRVIHSVCLFQFKYDVKGVKLFIFLVFTLRGQFWYFDMSRVVPKLCLFVTPESGEGETIYVTLYTRRSIHMRSH